MAENQGVAYNAGAQNVHYYVQPGQENPNPQMVQPVQMMAKPPTIPGVPPGLEYLTQIDQLLVHQQIEVFEILTGIEMCNKYRIKNSLGQQVYFAGEESPCCMRAWCGPSRGFVMHITDNFGQEVIRVVRDFKCCAGWNWCAYSAHCSLQIAVEAPVGQVVGRVKQQFSACAPKYVVEDASENAIFSIDGPICVFQCVCCPRDIKFPISSFDGGQEVGSISKQWGGYFREMIGDADNFGVSFPMDLDVRMKATLLGAVFLIDFMYFEHNQNNSYYY